MIIEIVNKMNINKIKYFEKLKVKFVGNGI
jgi:hypothetical protein